MDQIGQPATIPFRPAICVDPAVETVDEFCLETGMVIVAPTPPMTGHTFDGADKVQLCVAFPHDLERRYEVTGEFLCGTYDDTGGEVTIQLYANNELSRDLRVFTVRLPVEFIARVVTRYVGSAGDGQSRA
jgi:hypothetical protein